MLARVICIALRPTVVRFHRILHAIHNALLILLDAIRLLHAGEEAEGGLGTLLRLSKVAMGGEKMRKQKYIIAKM